MTEPFHQGEPDAADVPATRQNPAARAWQFIRQHRTAIGSVTGLLVVLTGLIALFRGDDAPPARRVQEFTIVNVVPPPPPPPPEVKPPEQQMIEQPQIKEPELKEEAKVEEPMDAPADALPPGPLELNAPAEGPGDKFNLRSGTGNGAGGGGGGGSRWGWYAAIVRQQIEIALRSNPKTRNLVAQVQVRLWADSSGRIIRVQLTPSTGDAAVDALIRSELLVGLTLRERPPADMPMPVVTRVTARRPG